MALPIMDDLKDLMPRVGNDRINNQSNAKCTAWSEIQHKTMSGGKQIVNVVTGGQLSVGKINGDGGTRQQGSSRKPVQGYELPKFLHGTLKFNNSILATYKDVGDAADYLEGEIDAFGEAFGMARGGSIYGTDGLICTIVSSAAATTGRVALTIPDIAGLLEGNAYEVVHKGVGQSDGYCYVLGLESIVLSSTGFGAVATFVDNVPGITHAFALNATNFPAGFGAGTQIYVRGSIVTADIGTALATTIDKNSDGSVSLDLVTATSGALHELNPATAGLAFWAGHRFDVNGAAGTQEMVLGRLGQVRRASGNTPDIMFVGEGLKNALAASSLTVASSAFGLSSVGNTRKMVDATFNKYGKEIVEGNRMMIGKTRIVLDDCCPSDSTSAAESASDGYAIAFAVNTDKLSIGVWQKLEPEKQGGDQFIVDHDEFATKAFYSEAFNLLCNQRRAHCKIFDIAVSV